MTDSVIQVGQLTIRYLIDGSASRSMGAFELTVPPGSNLPPPHSHADHEECLVVLEGRLRCTVGGDTRDLGAGEGRTTPPGVVHAFANPFADTARALVVLSPDIGAQYFREIAALGAAGSPPDRAAVAEVMRRHGLRLEPAPA